MINTLNQHRQVFQEALIHECEPFHYRFTRYHADYSIALAYVSEENGDLRNCGKYLRESDRIVFFQNNFCAILFDNTNTEQGIKAANNILSRVQDLFFTKHLYMAVITSSHERSEFQTVHDLFDLIIYAFEHKMENLVVDTSQIIQHEQSV